jgi:hypothetical protein
MPSEAAAASTRRRATVAHRPGPPLCPGGGERGDAQARGELIRGFASSSLKQKASRWTGSSEYNEITEASVLRRICEFRGDPR